MKFQGLASIALVASLASAQPAAEAEPPCAPERCCTQAEALEDLDVLYARMRDNHFDLFARRPAEEYGRLYRELREGIDGPVPRPRFHLVLHRLLAYGEIGHAKTEAALLGTLYVGCLVQ